MLLILFINQSLKFNNLIEIKLHFPDVQMFLYLETSGSLVFEIVI